MDKWGILIFVVGIAAYYFTRQKYALLVFISGIGAGIVVGAVWAYFLMVNLFP